ncbi:MAG: peptidylprolyl isomerase [Christensenellales bacterium]
MNRKITILFSVLIVAAMIFSACGVEEPKDTSTAGAPLETETVTASADETIIVAKIDGQPIYKNEFVTYLKQSGYGEDILQDKSYSEYIESILKTFVTEKVLRSFLEEKGYMNLTDEQIAKAEQDAQTDIDYYIESNYKPAIKQELGEDYTDEQYQAKKAEYEQTIFEGLGMTKEELIDMYKLSVAKEAAYADLVGDIKPTEQDVKAKYDENVASDKETIGADPTIYISDFLYGSTAYYVPAGVRWVKQVLIAFDEDTKNAISTLREAGYNDQADVVQQNGLQQIRQNAEDVLSKLQSGGLTFDQAIEQYNEDPGMNAKGYPIVEGTTDYVKSFTQAAMSLENIGTRTDLVPSDFGYHIIEYTADEPEGAVSFDNVKDEIYDELQHSLQGNAWSALIGEWEAGLNVVYYFENL